jgi:hypothetical protein
MIHSDLNGFCEFEINLLLNHFPENCQNLMKAIQDNKCIKNILGHLVELKKSSDDNIMSNFSICSRLLLISAF